MIFTGLKIIFHILKICLAHFRSNNKIILSFSAINKTFADKNQEKLKSIFKKRVFFQKHCYKVDRYRIFRASQSRILLLADREAPEAESQVPRYLPAEPAQVPALQHLFRLRRPIAGPPKRTCWRRRRTILNFS